MYTMRAEWSSHGRVDDPKMHGLVTEWLFKVTFCQSLFIITHTFNFLEVVIEGELRILNKTCKDAHQEQVDMFMSGQP